MITLPYFSREEDVTPPPGWTVKQVSDLYEQLPVGERRDQRTVDLKGKIPVLDQKERGYLGFHSGSPGVFASPSHPVVTFANHTCAMRVMRQPFSVIQNVFPKIGRQGVCSTLFLYYVTRGRIGSKSYKGHHPEWREGYVPLPPRNTQDAIVSLLLAYDELIENNLRRIEILEEMPRSIYREWFVNFRFPGYETTDKVDPELGSLPGWEMRELGDAATWLSGGTPKTQEAGYWNGDIPWITSGSLKSFLLDDSERKLTSAGVTAGSRLVDTDTLLFVVRGMSLAKEFRYGIADVPLAFGQDCKALVAVSDVEPLLLAFAVANMADKIQGMVEFAAHGTGKLSTDRLKRLRMPVSPQAVQAQFVRIIQPMRRLMTDLRHQVRILSKTRDLLLPKLISGEIDVTELDIDTSWLVA